MTSHPVNPFKTLREKQGISQYELSRRTGLSKHAVLRLEQGMYPNPLLAVVDYFIAYFPKLTPVGLSNDYQEFQIATRQLNSRLLGDLLPSLALVPHAKHPLTFLRESVGLNTTEVAKKLCIAQNLVYYFEQRSIHQHTVPDQLITALWDADYTEQETDALKEAYLAYRQVILENKNVLIK